MSRAYYSPDCGQCKRVCSDFFSQTLDVGIHGIQKCLEKRHEIGNMIAHLNKSSDWKSELICTYIGFFPTMKSHYCRKDSQRKYLDSTLSIRLMYQDFVKYYKTMILKEGKDRSRSEFSCPRELVYRRIFRSRFNLSFSVPKKDQCQTCAKYEVSLEMLKEKWILNIKNILKAKTELNKKRSKTKIL